MPTTTDLEIIQFDRPPEAKKIPNEHLILGLDRQSGEPFGNATFRKSGAILCASFDGVSMIVEGEAVLFPLSWLYTEYHKERKIWEAQRDALRKYAQENGLPFIEPWEPKT